MGFQLLEPPVHFGFRLVEFRPELAGLMASNLPASFDLHFHGVLLPKKEKPVLPEFRIGFSYVWESRRERDFLSPMVSAFLTYLGTTPPQLGGGPIVAAHLNEQVDQAAIATGHLQIGRSPFQTDHFRLGNGRVSSLRQLPRFLHN